MEDILSRLAAEGFRLTEFVPDGRPHRFKVDDSDDKKSGYYIGYRNFSATTGEGDQKELMGIRHKTLPIEGIQFHPESFATEGGVRMIESFLVQKRSS